MSILEARPTAARDLSSAAVCNLTGITYRQLDLWCRRGYLGPRHMHVRSGRQRRFSVLDLEVVDAVRQLHNLGCCTSGPTDRSSSDRREAYLSAITVIRARPVAAGGEYLIVTLDPPRARRCDTFVFDDLSAEQPPLWVVRLRSFDVPLQAAKIASSS